MYSVLQSDAVPPNFIVLLNEGFVFLEYQLQHSNLEAKYFCKCVYFSYNSFLIAQKGQRSFFFMIYSLQAFGSDAFLMIQWKYYCWFRVYLYFSVLSEAQQGLLSYTSLCFQLHQDNYVKPIIVSCFFNNLMRFYYSIPLARLIM